MSSEEYFNNKEFEFYRSIENDFINRGFKYLAQGYSRTGYGRNNIVIKIPHNKLGIEDNIIEAKAYSKYKNGPTNLGYYLAPCRLIKHNCLIMHRVKILSRHDKRFPKWGTKIDNHQVGISLVSNKIVCYDYALDMEEK